MVITDHLIFLKFAGTADFHRFKPYPAVGTGSD